MLHLPINGLEPQEWPASHLAALLSACMISPSLSSSTHSPSQASRFFNADPSATTLHFSEEDVSFIPFPAIFPRHLAHGVGIQGACLRRQGALYAHWATDAGGVFLLLPRACEESFEFSTGLVGCRSRGYKGCGGMTSRILGSRWMMRRDMILLLLLLESLDLVHLFERLLALLSHVANWKRLAVSYMLRPLRGVNLIWMERSVQSVARG
ncbi:uncharacterized protein CC84DRAFT_1168381 [Paraphaeosphaeria sporulosa]|uniref:Uncharacterized protein n=1 Tax=Paraphaeosphaeria sporulosa TaxID=1460663 RepID=A0A177C1G9_9PLEO|nr:uncharacterized protein CC84DRAFT_1168381 [Paraphaeosphaeria sporulosa]OAG01276.1 hypothetical protein CC84DRAFT_1168381 [Paraphaeosphaeria sporulosa]